MRLGGTLLLFFSSSSLVNCLKKIIMVLLSDYLKIKGPLARMTLKTKVPILKTLSAFYYSVRYTTLIFLGLVVNQ